MVRSNIGWAALYGAWFAVSCGGRASEPFDQTGSAGSAGSAGSQTTGTSKATSGAGGASSATTTTTSTPSSGTGVGTTSTSSTNGAAGWSISSDVGTTTTGPTPTSGGGQGGYGNTVSTTTLGATTTTRCGNPGIGGSGGAPPTGPAPGANAVVLTRSQFPPPPPSGTGSSSTSGGGSVGDDGTQFLNIGTGSVSCQQPGSGGCGTWHLSISIEPALFKAGKIDLCGISYFSASGPDRGVGDCSFGGGTFDHGTLEILSITDDIVKVRLTGARSSDLDADGQYDVVRCH